MKHYGLVCLFSELSNKAEYVGKHKSIKWKLTTRHKYLPKVCITKRHGQLGIGTVLSKHKRTEDREITITI